MELLKITLVVLLVGSSYARPQTADVERIQETSTQTTNTDWKALRSTEKTTENVRGDSSRYTDNSGSRRKSYINYYRDTNASPSIESSRSSSNSDRNEVSSVRRSSFDQFIDPPKKEYSSHPNDSLVFTQNSRSVYASRRLKLNKLDLATQKLVGRTRENVNTKENDLDDSRYSKLDDDSLSDALNNSGKRESTLNRNPNSEEEVTKAILDRGYRKNAVASTYRNSVKVRHRGITSVESTNRFDQVDAVRRVTNMLLKTREKIDTRPELTRRIKIREDPSRLNFNDLREPIERSKLSGKRKIHSNGLPIKREDDNNKLKNETNASQRFGSTTSNSLLKNWPNDFPKDAEDFYNYEKYTTLPDQVQGSSQNSSVHHRVPAMQEGIQEIVQWLKVPAFASNQSQMLEMDGGPISVTFKPLYEDLEPNSPLQPSDDNSLSPSNGNILFHDLVHHDSQHVSPAWQTSSNYGLNPPLGLPISTPLPPKKPVYKPMTHITQNTVVHILNTNLKKTNSTKTDTKDPQNTSKPPKETVDLSGIKLDDNCPTIMISSITKVNNTIQGKEGGCTDLNIIINSQIVNSNVIKPVDTVLDDPSNLNSDSNESNESDKYVGSPENTNYPVPSNDYVSSSTAISNPPSYQNDYTSQKDEILQPQVSSEPNYVSSDVPTIQVVQNTQVSVTNSNEQLNDVDGSTLTEIPSQQEPSGSTGDAVVPTGEQEQPSSTFVDSPAVEQGNSGSSGLQVAGLQNRPGSSNVASLAGNRPTSGVASGSVLGDETDDDEDEDDDDDEGFDLSPGGVLEAIASTFTYLTFFNPMHYFVSLAAAPFAALAAGVLGISAFLFPWAFPSAFDFGRANEAVKIRFRPNLEEVVKQSFQKYKRLNEWKSKRRKRRYLEF